MATVRSWSLNCSLMLAPYMRRHNILSKILDNILDHITGLDLHRKQRTMTSKRSCESFKRYCCVYGCLNKAKSNESKLTFFRIPKDFERRQEWLIAINREDLLDEKKINKAHFKVVCSAHFDESAIITTTSKRLKHDAVPTKLLPYKSHKNVQTDTHDLIKTTKNTSAYKNLSEGRSPKDTTLRSYCQVLSMSTPLKKSEKYSNQPEKDDFCISEQGTIEEEWCIPAALRVCKLCLSIDAKMYQLNNNYFLAQLYQDIMGISPRTDADNRLPMGICWECTARLQSAASFRTKVLFSDALLQDHLKNNADLTITDIENLHRQHTILKPTMALQEVFKFDNHNLDEQVPNTLIKSEVIGIPHNEEIEIEVGNLVSKKITIKDENNEIIEEINTNGDVKTEIDLIPTELEAGDREDSDNFSEDDCRIVEENVNVNDMKVSLDNIVLFNSESSTDIVNISNNVGKLEQSGKDIYSDDVIDFIYVDVKANKAVVNEDKNKPEVKKEKAVKRKAKTVDEDVIDIIDVDAQANKAVMNEDKNKTEVKKKKAVKRKAKTVDEDVIDIIDVDAKANKAVVNVDKNKTEVKKKKAVKRKANTDDDDDGVIIWVKGKRRKTSDNKNQTNQGEMKKEPYVKPYFTTPIDGNIFTVKTLNHDDLRKEILARKDSCQYKEAPFKCDVCFRGFLTEDIQARHMLKHTEEYGSLECNICHIRSAIPRHMRTHIRNQHTSEFICKLCPMVTRNRNVAVVHKRYHDGNKYECPQCLVEFGRKTALYDHQRLKHMSACVCELCGYTFVSKAGVEVHKHKRHKLFDKNTEFTGQFCEVCDVKFLTEKAYNRHLLLSSNHIKEGDPNRINNDPSIKERRLAATNARKSRLRRAVKDPRDPNTEPAANGPHTCEQCGMVLENLRAYAAHFRKSHTGMNRTQFGNTNTYMYSYMCEHCGKLFQNKTLLSAHMWVHDGQKRFQCDHCHKSFAMKSTLVGHMQQHQAVRPTYDCHVCGKPFMFSNNLTRHMFLHTGLRPFKCDACEKTFPTIGELRLHVDHVHLRKPRPKRVRRKVKKLDDD